MPSRAVGDWVQNEKGDQPMDRDHYDKRAQAIRHENEAHLAAFREDLQAAGLDRTTIRKHLRNAEDYLDHFLAGEELLTMAEGASGERLDSYIGDFLIGQSMLASGDTISWAADSIRLFYRSMRERGAITEDAFDGLVRTIEELSPEWTARLALFQGTGRKDPFAFR